jgi:hypothetical protein
VNHEDSLCILIAADNCQWIARAVTEIGRRRSLRILESERRLGGKVARFRQVKKEQPHVHHDALEFPDGQIVLLTQLCVGEHATVLQLPAAPRTAQEAEEQKRVAVVA